MTTASLKMNRRFIAHSSLVLFILMVILGSCTKGDQTNRSNQVSNYSSEVLDKWMTLQIRLMRNATGIPNHGFSRHYVYAGIAALESLSPGLPAHAAWNGRWNGLTGLPQASHSIKYHFPANVNAALAAINKAMFPAANALDKLAIDSLENALNSEFLNTQSADIISASAQFGKDVAAAVYNWSETDGYKTAGGPYTAPVGAGLWEPTAPAYSSAVTPYWGNNRPVMKNSTDNTQPAAPLSYSTDPHSGFYQMVKQVYDVSQSLTDDQKAMASFWRDVPGVTSPGHWLSIVRQVISKTNTALDKAALTYALTGVAINDGLISCLKSKYQYNLVRPITYIRNVMGHSTWTSFLGTPAHPEYSSAHAVLSVAAGDVMDKLFGNIGVFTDRTYDYLGYAARNYSSLKDIGTEAAQSRLYAGIHYQPSIDIGIVQGRKIAENIFSFNGNDLVQISKSK